MHQIKFPKCDYEGQGVLPPVPPGNGCQTGRHVSNVPNPEVVRFGVATLIHDVGASPQSRIGRSEN